MESEVLPILEQFMLSPLVTWVKTFGQIGEKDAGISILSEYTELVDGFHLNTIMDQINPKAATHRVTKVNNDSCQRIQNLSTLIQQIKTYYQETLQQLIMMSLPNVLVLGRTPFCEHSVDEMKKLLLLLLGCAVQCEKKEEYIDVIQTLDFDTKAAIASHIQEVTHSQESVFDLHWLEVSDLCPEDLESLSRSMALHLRRLVDQRDQQLETIVELLQERECVQPAVPGGPSPSEASSLHQPAAQKHLAVELADTKAKTRRLRQELEEKSEQLLDCRQELENMETELKRIQQENMLLLTDARAARAYRDELDSLREKAIRADKLESEVGRYRDKLHNMQFYKAKVQELKEDNQVLLETKAMLEEQLVRSRTRSDKLHQLEKHSLLLQAKLHDMEEERCVERRRMEELLEENLALEMAQKRSMEESLHLGWELEQLSKSSKHPEGTVAVALQKSLGQEVSERTSSRLLRLERENQSLLRTVEELRGAREPSEEHRNYSSLKLKVKVLTAENELLNNCVSSLRRSSGVRGDAGVGGVESVERADGTGSTHGEPLPERPHSNPEGAKETKELDGEIHGPAGEESERSQEECGSSGREKAEREAESGGPKERESRKLRAPSEPETRASAEQASGRRAATADTENRRLLAALGNAGRKLQRLQGELRDVEQENQGLQAGLEELRIGARRLDALEQDNRGLEQEAAQLERDKGRLEKENRRLRQRAEIQEATLDSSSMRQAGLEKENRVLGKELSALRETSVRVKELERDSRELLKQAAIDQRTLATLREELVSEKLKTRQKENDLEKLSHELDRMGLTQEQLLTDQDTADHRYKLLESELESSLKRSLEIKEEKISALEARLHESSSLNQQLRQELKTLKLSYEAVLQREEEEREGRSSPPQAHAAREWQRESQEATRELLKVKDRLIEVERNNATLQAERQALHAQLKQLQMQTDGLSAQILALQRQTASLQESNTALQTQNAQLQVEKSTLSSQSASLMAQNATLQRQQCSAEGEKENAVRDRDDLRTVNELLLRDHERLAALHERQAAEYEALISRHGALKSSHRSLELEHRSLEDSYNTLLQQKAQLEGLERALKEEQQKMQWETDKHQSTAAECQRLRDDKDWLNQTYQKLLRENEGLHADHKSLKSQLNSSQLEQTRLQTEFSKLREQHQQLDITSTKLTNQCELLTQLKGNLEEENRHLLDQIHNLMLQNRTLLEQTMESKDLFHVEQRQYMDKLSELRRQKEKLEEKIMDQYKFYEPSPPRRRGNWIALKVRKLIKSRSRERVRSLTPPTRSESCEGLPNDLRCHDNGSFVGSQGSVESGSNSPKRSSTMNDLLLHEGLWAGRSERLEGREEEEEEEGVRKNLLQTSMSLSTDLSTKHTTPSHLFTATDHSKPEVKGKGKDSREDVARSCFDDNDDARNRGLSGGAPSESSGEFSLSLESEAWSGGSSPVQEPPSRRCSDTSAPPCGSSSSGRGVWRSSSGRATGDHSLGRASSGPRQGLLRSESIRESSSSPPRPAPPAVAKSSSASGCLDCFATPLRREGRAGGTGRGGSRGLPRASSVISTSEGSARRASIHSMMSAKAAAAAPSPSKNSHAPQGADLRPSPPPPFSEAAEGPRPSSLEPIFSSQFNIDSVFADTIFGEPALAGNKSQTFLCLNTSLVHSISGVPSKPPAAPSAAAQPANLCSRSETGPKQNGGRRSAPRDCATNENVAATDHMTVNDPSSILTSENKQSLVA